MPDKIKIRDLSLTFSLTDRKVEVFNSFNLDIDPKDFTVILGRSGCGKTTLLRLLAGLLKPSSGSIEMPGEISPGLMFQEARLMPWLTCEKNIALGLKEPDPKQIQEILELVGLKGFEKAYPNQLSGGMQQRASLARTLIRHSNLILMDEPFAALDAFTRESMQKELLRIRSQRDCGVILVTHNIDEALMLADRIVLLSGGESLKEYVMPCRDCVRDILTEPYISYKKEIQNLIRR
ncbi:MAG: ATP-binding cassette domain-containing protein [Oscillospiraceae bacterium]|nr:ATP-binding cassette domain-containing protein [Oscillospiraceae bacterium]